MPRLSLLIALVVGSLTFSSAQAALRVAQVCTLDGQQEIRLTGMGIVVGLLGTGDSGDLKAAMQHLAQFSALNGSPVKSLDDLKKAGGGVAVVSVSATIPRTGISAGQSLDVYVKPLYGTCKSLLGGELILTPMGKELLSDSSVLGLASGDIIIEDKTLPTGGRIPNGLTMKESVDMRILRRNKQVRLLINPEYASLSMAREVARAVNDKFYLEAGNKEIARAVSTLAVDVNIPDQYDNHVEFGALLEEVILKESTRPRVVVNVRSGTVVVTGDVEISPAVVSHRSLTVDTTERFVALQDPSKKQNPQQLSDLLDALNRLRVPTSDMIAILRQLSESGRLHAEFVVIGNK